VAKGAEAFICRPELQCCMAGVKVCCSEARQRYQGLLMLLYVSYFGHSLIARTVCAWQRCFAAQQRHCCALPFAAGLEQHTATARRCISTEQLAYCDLCY
jgi:hypothetical protein